MKTVLETPNSEFDTRAAESALRRFLSRLRDSRERTVKEVEKTLHELSQLVQAVLTNQENSPEELESLLERRRRLRAELLEKPLRKLERSSAQKRLTMALESYRHSLREAARNLPDEVTGSPAELARSLELEPSRYKGKSKACALRSQVLLLLAQQARKRSKMEDDLAFFAVQALDFLRANWKARMLGRREECERLSIEWARVAEDNTSKLKSWRDLTVRQEQEFPAQLMRRVYRRPGKLSSPTPSEHRDAQVRSVEGELHLLKSLESAWEEVWKELGLVDQSFKTERADIVEEMTELADWLGELLDGQERSKLPLASVRVAPLPARRSTLEARLHQCARTLPLNVSVLSQLRAGAHRLKWTQLYPQESFRHALGIVSGSMIEQLELKVSEHQQLVAGCDRVRDVIHYGLDLENEESMVVAREALENALSLLRHELTEAETPYQPLSSLHPVVSELYQDLLLRLDRQRAKANLHMLKRRLRFEGQALMSGAGTAAGDLFYRAGEAGKKRGQEFLGTIGFSKLDSTVSTIEVRNYLPKEYAGEVLSDLPAVYRRLFRIEPVEEQRFLVGRSRETQAVLDAVDLWESGRVVSIILTGQRGSGKTSLLNCLTEQMAEHNLTRGEFGERLLTADDMDRFLRDLLALEEGDLVEQILEGERGLVVLEEMERTFLRKVEGYSAIRRLQNIIAATSQKILWVMAINEVSYNFLCRSVDLAPGFTHRIKTAVASLEDLQSAIMVRHELSGLRLRFRSRFERPSRLRDLRRKLSREKEPEALFFERLAKQSKGVYRTALEVWLGHIEACEGGILYMRQVREPSLDGVLGELDNEDLFTLVAILQHGSLTTPEHALVFSRKAASSQAQLEELIGRELIEQDPHHPGFRVRPEAMPVVKEALYRRNLL